MNLDFNGYCCEFLCTSCDYYLIICLKEIVKGFCGKFVMIIMYYNIKFIVFKEGEVFFSGEKNFFVWKFNLW